MADIESQQLEEVFVATFLPETTKEAELKLKTICHQPGFGLSLSQLLRKPDLSPHVQKAVAVYLKNFLTRYWIVRGDTFSIPEEEKAMIRGNIVDLICGCTIPIQTILAVAFGRILSHDYPENMPPSTVVRIGQHMQSSELQVVVGSLYCFLELSKKYEYKNVDERASYDTLIPQAFPFLLQIGTQTATMETVEKTLVLKLVLKIFFSAIHFSLPTPIQDTGMLSPWMTLFGQVITSDVPELEDPATGKNPGWLAKKWACNIIYEMFHRYGIPSTAIKKDKAFATMFIKTYAIPASEMALTLLINSHREAKFVSSRVQHICINIINAAVSHNTTWKVVKPNLGAIIADIIFPVLCHSERDEELWQDDPHEYTREKFDVIADFVSPAVAAQTLLAEITTKRKGTLMPCLQFCNTVLIEYTQTLTAAQQHQETEEVYKTVEHQTRRKDGALSMIGTLAGLINMKTELAGTLEQMLVTHVFPEFTSRFGFMRARACWILQHFSGVALANEQVVIQAMDCLIQCLHDPDLPVRVMSGVGLKVMVEYPVAKERIRPHLGQVLNELVSLTNEAENDDIVSVMEDLVAAYGTDLGDVSIQLSAQLAQTFCNMLKTSDEDNDEDIHKAMTALGTLRALKTIIGIYAEKPEMLVHIESAILPCVYMVLNENHIDYLEDVLEMLSMCLFLREVISPEVWTLIPAIYQIFKAEAFDYFNEMMPVLDLCLTHGASGFFEHPNYITAVYEMCAAVMTNDDAGEDMHCKAAMLVASAFINLRGDKFPRASGIWLSEDVHTKFMLILLNRLNSKIVTQQLKVSLLMAMAGGIFSNAHLSLSLMESLVPNSAQTDKYFSELFENLGHFKRVRDLHLIIATMCELLTLNDTSLPAVVREKYPLVQMVQVIVDAFKILPAAEKRREEWDELVYGEVDSEDETAFNQRDAALVADHLEGEISDDDDYQDDEGDEYLKMLAKVGAKGEDADSDDDEEAELFDDDEVWCDNIVDTMNPYVLFRDTLHAARGLKGDNTTQPGIGSNTQDVRSAESFRLLLEALPAESQQVVNGNDLKDKDKIVVKTTLRQQLQMSPPTVRGERPIFSGACSTTSINARGGA
eukprot:CFRG2617T1